MLELEVCIGSACHLKGSYNVIQTFQQEIEKESLHDEIEMKAQFCMQKCQDDGVIVSVNGKPYSISPNEAKEFFSSVVKSAI